MSVKCDKCGTERRSLAGSDSYCPNMHCPGKVVSVSMSPEPTVGVKDGAKLCPECGRRLVIDGAGTPFCPSFMCRETEPWSPDEEAPETCRQATRDNTDMSKGGVKIDTNKLRYDLLPWDAVSEIVKVHNHGAAKYEDRNWEGGMHYSRMWAAAIRHLVQFWSGEELDSKSGLPHLAHAGCMVLFLLSHTLRDIGTDDRPEDECNQPDMTYDAGDMTVSTRSPEEQALLHACAYMAGNWGYTAAANGEDQRTFGAIYNDWLESGGEIETQESDP